MVVKMSSVIWIAVLCTEIKKDLRKSSRSLFLHAIFNLWKKEFRILVSFIYKKTGGTVPAAELVKVLSQKAILILLWNLG